MAEPSREAFRRVHLLALAVVGVALPWSLALISIGQLLLVGNWFVEGFVRRDLGQRLKHAFTWGPSLVFISLLGLHGLGLLWTEDLSWGLDLCRILLPVLAFGAILAASPRLAKEELRGILLLGAWSTLLSTLACLVLSGGAAPGDYRGLSHFISHIRLALLLCMSVFVLVAYMPRQWKGRALHLAGIVWTLVFMGLLGSVLALVILAVAGVVVLFRHGQRWYPPVRYIALGVAALSVVTLVAWMTGVVRPVLRAQEPELGALPERSAGGEPYYHDRERPQVENGHPVWVCVADSELTRGWARLSEVPLTENDARGHPMRTTLIRYLASLGQNKDSVGLLALEPRDVQRIEKGVPSVKLPVRGSYRTRLEEIAYELDQYRRTGDPSGHSLPMRLEFWRTGWHILKRHPITGVGTGDTQLAFNLAYVELGSHLTPEWRLRAHDQYLTWAISFGVLGGLWCLFAWLWPAWRLGAFGYPLFLAWLVAFTISCFTDDTVETQVGATFFAYFYALFVFARPLPEGN
ncbi:MAG: O-antigen ligase family protein [Flavobacteriales bacterium]|nr:O-antigen ligase family protein [Flavobacteriales bacterium]